MPETRAAFGTFGVASNYLEEQLLRLRFNLSPVLTAANRWLAISTGGPWGEDGTGGTEPALSAGYLRMELDKTKWSTPAASFESHPAFPTVVWAYLYSTYTDPIVFPTPTADWGTGPPAHAAIFDADFDPAHPFDSKVLISFEIASLTNLGPGYPPPKPGGTPLTFAAGAFRIGFIHERGDTDTFDDYYTHPPPAMSGDPQWWTGDNAAFINHITGKIAFTPITPYLGLSSDFSGTEPTDPSYSRRQLISTQLIGPTQDVNGDWIIQNKEQIWGPMNTTAYAGNPTLWKSAVDATANFIWRNADQSIPSAASLGDSLQLPDGAITWRFQ